MNLFSGCGASLKTMRHQAVNLAAPMGPMDAIKTINEETKPIMSKELTSHLIDIRLTHIFDSGWSFIMD